MEFTEVHVSLMQLTPHKVQLCQDTKSTDDPAQSSGAEEVAPDTLHAHSEARNNNNIIRNKMPRIISSKYLKL